LGLPLQRDGVHISVIRGADPARNFNILIGKECSGLTSLIVLLALGYLVAFLTPARLWARILLFLSVVPLAIAMNAVRLTVILLFGAYASRALAEWVHNNEGPVLILICSVGLLLMRSL